MLHAESQLHRLAERNAKSCGGLFGRLSLLHTPDQRSHIFPGRSQLRSRAIGIGRAVGTVQWADHEANALPGDVENLTNLLEGQVRMIEQMPAQDSAEIDGRERGARGEEIERLTVHGGSVTGLEQEVQNFETFPKAKKRPIPKNPTS